MTTCKIRRDQNNNMMELWIDGHYVAAWTGFKLSGNAQGKIEYMLATAVEFGEEKKTKEFLSVLNIL